MKVKGLIIIALTGITLAACQGNPGVTNKCGPCPLYAEIAPFVNVSIVDKATGADLLLSPGSPYKFSDLVVTSSLTGTNVTVIVDSLQNDSRFIRVLCPGSQTFTFKLAALSQDSMKVVTARDSPVCCPRLRIKQIFLDSISLCSPCSFSQVITIKK